MQCRNRKQLAIRELLACILVGVVASVAGCDLSQTIGGTASRGLGATAGRILPQIGDLPRDVLLAIDVDEDEEDGVGMGWPPE